jgi:hypothetical protein
VWYITYCFEEGAPILIVTVQIMFLALRLPLHLYNTQALLDLDSEVKEVLSNTELQANGTLLAPSNAAVQALYKALNFGRSIWALAIVNA